jgi:hypothetical protein
MFLAAVLIALLPFFAWRMFDRQRRGPALGSYVLVVSCSIFVFGLLGLAAGVFLPLLLGDSPQRPLASFVTAPLGAVVGILAAWIWLFLRRRGG